MSGVNRKTPYRQNLLPKLSFLIARFTGAAKPAYHKNFQQFHLGRIPGDTTYCLECAKQNSPTICLWCHQNCNSHSGLRTHVLVRHLVLCAMELLFTSYSSAILPYMAFNFLFGSLQCVNCLFTSSLDKGIGRHLNGPFFAIPHHSILTKTTQDPVQTLSLTSFDCGGVMVDTANFDPKFILMVDQLLGLMYSPKNILKNRKWLCSHQRQRPILVPGTRNMHSSSITLYSLYRMGFAAVQHLQNENTDWTLYDHYNQKKPECLNGYWPDNHPEEWNAFTTSTEKMPVPLYVFFDKSSRNTAHKESFVDEIVSYFKSICVTKRSLVRRNSLSNTGVKKCHKRCNSV